MVTVCWKWLVVKIDEPLLARYQSRDYRHIATAAPLFAQLEGYTVRQYLIDILSGTKDLLIDAALQHRITTGGGTSRLALDHTPRATLGVMEVRDIGKSWPLGTWFAKAMPWLKRAYNMTKDWDRDLAAEQEYEAAVLFEYRQSVLQEQAYEEAWAAHYS